MLFNVAAFVMRSSWKLHMYWAFFTDDLWYWPVDLRHLCRNFQHLGWQNQFWMCSIIRQDSRLTAHLQNHRWQSVPFTALIHPFIESTQVRLNYLPVEEDHTSRRSDLLTSLIGFRMNWPLFNPHKVPFVILWAQVHNPHNLLHCLPCWWGSWAGAPWPAASRFLPSSAGFVLKRQVFIIAASSADEAFPLLKVHDTKSWNCFPLLYRSLMSCILQPLLSHLQQALLSAWKYPLHLHRNQQELQLRTTLKFHLSPLPTPLISVL